MPDRAQPIVDHYHLTYDIAYKLWEKRNTSFLHLVAALVVAALFTYDLQVAPGPGKSPFMFTFLCLFSDKCTDVKLAELTSQFPYRVFNGAVSVLVFYLMMNMFTQSSNISRYYAYIVRLEDEIRSELGFEEGVAFTREGKFAASRPAPLRSVVAYFYMLILGGLLTFYFAFRIGDEARGGIESPSLWVHVTLSFLTAILFFGYVRNSLSGHRSFAVGASAKGSSPPP